MSGPRTGTAIYFAVAGVLCISNGGISGSNAVTPLQAHLHNVAPVSWWQVRQDTHSLSAICLSRFLRSAVGTSYLYMNIALIV